MKWRPQDVVALVLALSILAFFVGTLAVRALGIPASPEHIALKWENLLMALIGGLIGYVAGTSRSD